MRLRPQLSCRSKLIIQTTQINTGPRRTQDMRGMTRTIKWPGWGRLPHALSVFLRGSHEGGTKRGRKRTLGFSRFVPALHAPSNTSCGESPKGKGKTLAGSCAGPDHGTGAAKGAPSVRRRYPFRACLPARSGRQAPGPRMALIFGNILRYKSNTEHDQRPNRHGASADQSPS